MALTTSETAEALAVSERTLEGWRVRGGGPPFVKMSRGVVRYRQDDLQRWLTARTVANTAQGDHLSG